MVLGVWFTICFLIARGSILKSENSNWIMEPTEVQLAHVFVYILGFFLTPIIVSATIVLSAIISAPERVKSVRCRFWFAFYQNKALGNLIRNADRNAHTTI